MTALRATLSADDEQHKAATLVEGAAYDQEVDLSGALPGAHHVLEDLHAMENSLEGRAGLPHASMELGTSANGQKDKSLLDNHPSTIGPRGVGETLPVRSESTGTTAAAQSSGQQRPRLNHPDACTPSHNALLSLFRSIQYACRKQQGRLNPYTCPVIMKVPDKTRAHVWTIF